jgi:DNA-directed RNA polymerase III subunit RPC6
MRLALVLFKTFPRNEGEGDSDAIRDNGYEGYPTPNDILGFIRKTGITNVELTVADIRQLLERLVYDGLVSKRQKAGSERFGDQAYAPTKTTSVPKPKKRKRKIIELEDESDAEIIGEIDSDEGMMMIEEAVEDEDMWMYVARRREVKDVEKSGEKSVGTGCAMPCGKCPVFAFCQVGGPVNPENCEYLDEWLGGF